MKVSEKMKEHKLVDRRLVHHLDKIDTIAEIQARKEEGIELEERLIGADIAAYSYENYKIIVQFYNMNTIGDYCINEEFDVEKISSIRPYLLELKDLQDDTKRVNLSNKRLREHKGVPQQKGMVHIWPRLILNIEDMVNGKTSFEEIHGAETTKLLTAIYGEGTYRAAGTMSRFGTTKGNMTIHYPNENKLNNILFKHNNTNTKYLLAVGIGEWTDIGSDLISGTYSGTVELLEESKPSVWKQILKPKNT